MEKISNDKELEKKVNIFLENEIFNKKEVNLNSNSKDDLLQIQKILLSGKYRKFPVTDEIKEMLTKSINFILENEVPFLFVPSFGGYKHSWTCSYPHTDWAELFNILCLYNYLLPIYELTKKEIIVEYLSKDIIVPKMNNIPLEFVNQYIEDFRKLIDFINKFQKEIKFEFHSSHEDYEVDTLFDLMQKCRDNIEEQFKKLSIEEQEKRLKKSENNYCWNGVNNYEKSNELKKRQIIYNSRIINETFLKVDSELRGGSTKGRPNAIPILFRKGVGACGEIGLNLCSCPSSTIAFWVGIGILEIRENKIIPRIISKTQYETLQDKLIKVKVNIKELININENYSFIYVYVGEIKL